MHPCLRFRSAALWDWQQAPEVHGQWVQGDKKGGNLDVLGPAMFPQIRSIPKAYRISCMHWFSNIAAPYAEGTMLSLDFLGPNGEENRRWPWHFGC